MSLLSEKKNYCTNLLLKSIKDSKCSNGSTWKSSYTAFFVIAILKKNSFLRSESNIKLTYNTNKIKKETTLQLVSSIRG